MRRLSDACSLEAMLRREAGTVEMIDAIARRLVDFHRDHPLAAGADHLGTLESISTDWDENFTQTRDDVGKTISPERYGIIREAVGRFLERRADWFEQRLQEGRIRDCHGDVRAEHIYVESEQLHMIDCIEFNKRFRFIDVASDIAFLAVDLERLGASALAHHFVRSYAGYSADLALYRWLDFSRCYRAYVRGKVTSIRLRDMSASARRSQLEQRAEVHFALAETYARRLSRPLLVCTTGLLASGKSMVAEGLAAALDLQWIRSDQVRKELAGVASQTSQRAAYGAGIYTPEATQKTYAALADRARQALAHGHAVVLDASFSKRAERQRIVDLAEDLGADCCMLECLAPEAVIRHRLRQREDVVERISDAREDILAAFQSAYEPVHPHEGTCHVRVDTTQSLDVCVSQALADRQQQRP
jgi:predicted kinase